MKRMRKIRDEWTEEDVEFLSQQGLKAKVGMMTIPLDEDDRYYMIRQHFLTHVNRRKTHLHHFSINCLFLHRKCWNKQIKKKTTD